MCLLNIQILWIMNSSAHKPTILQSNDIYSQWILTAVSKSTNNCAKNTAHVDEGWIKYFGNTTAAFISDKKTSAECIYGGSHVRYKWIQYGRVGLGYAYGNVLPLHFSSFLHQVLLARNKTNTKEKNKNPLYADLCLVFMAPSTMEKWLPRTET